MKASGVMVGVGTTELLFIGLVCMGMFIVPAIVAIVVFRIVGGQRREHGGREDKP